MDTSKDSQTGNAEEKECCLTPEQCEQLGLLQLDRVHAEEGPQGTPPASPPRPMRALVERDDVRRVRRPARRPIQQPDESFFVEEVIGRNLFSRRLIRQYGNRRAQDFAYRVSITDDDWDGLDFVHGKQRLRALWQGLMEHLKREETVDGEDLVRIHFNHPSLDAGDIKVNLQRFADLTPEVINDRLGEVAQSKRGLTFDGDLEIMVGLIKFPRLL